MNLNVLYGLLSVDLDQKSSYALSTKSDCLAFPILKIASARYCYNECRYNFKKFFIDNSNEFIEFISYSFFDIQNPFVLSYLENINVQQEKPLYDLDNELFILCGAIIEKKITKKDFYWTPFDYSIETISQNLYYPIIDQIIKRSF